MHHATEADHCIARTKTANNELPFVIKMCIIDDQRFVHLCGQSTALGFFDISLISSTYLW